MLGSPASGFSGKLPEKALSAPSVTKQGRSDIRRVVNHTENVSCSCSNRACPAVCLPRPARRLTTDAALVFFGADATEETPRVADVLEQAFARSSRDFVLWDGPLGERGASGAWRGRLFEGQSGVRGPVRR